jgi:hypothetical protein
MKTEDKRALVYAHTFNNGVKYFGNAVDPTRPYNFSKGRGKKYLAQYELDPNPTIDIIASKLTVEEADALERKLFDEYELAGGVRCQQRPSGKDLQDQIHRSSCVDYQCPVRRKKLSETGRLVHPDFSGENNPFYAKSHTDETKEKISKANYKVISSLDGRISSRYQYTYWNKKNPAYIGTWSKLIPQ